MAQRLQVLHPAQKGAISWGEVDSIIAPGEDKK